MVILNEYSKKYSKNQSPTEENEMSDSDIAIKVDGVNKAFKLPHEKQSSVKGMFVGLFQGKRTYTKQQVLKDISFEIKKGEFFGIVGRNGSGKSTLLKLLAGIYTPDKGNIQVNGSLTPFIELGVGFNPELTGRENVYLNGALLGFNRKQMDAMYHEIVEFAELEKFMDQKLKNYSSGMQVRLAFSIAIRAKSDILLIDEVLAVGDEAFQQKCITVFEKLKSEQKTIILVTHDMAMVEKFCNRALMLQDGTITITGEPTAVADKYTDINKRSFIEEKNKHIQSKLKEEGLRVSILDTVTKKQKHIFKYNEQALVRIVWSNQEVKNVGVGLVKESGEYIFGPNTFGLKTPVNFGNSITLQLGLPISKGEYYLMIGLFGDSEDEQITFFNEGPPIVVKSEGSGSSWHGMVYLPHSWSIN